MNPISRDVFRPREGAVVDLQSLEAVASAPSDILLAWLTMRWPGCTGLVLDGLDLQGELAPGGPPGAVRPDGMAGGAVVTPGRALVSGRDGRLYLVDVPEPLTCPWPDASGPRVRGALVLFAAQTVPASEAGLAVAREQLVVQAGFVRPDVADQPHLLPIARAVGNGQDWATDLARVMQPEHAAVRALLKRFERLEQSVWKAEPEGSVWDRQVLGRSWVRYQTIAAAGLQAARVELATRSMTTLERVRLLTELKTQLERSVERVATELLQLVGPADGAGPYRRVTGTA
jgi:hypothetical protein